jgi:hypothetical protein
MTVQVTNLSDTQYKMIAQFGKAIHDRFLIDFYAKFEDIEAWIEKIYRIVGRPKPIIQIALNPSQMPFLRSDPDILNSTLQLVTVKRGKYISGKYSWKIRMWMYRTVFDQRMKGLYSSVENSLHANIDQDYLAEHRMISTSFTVVEKAANMVAEAYCLIDPTFPISDFYCSVCRFTDFDIFCILTAEKECWVLKLPTKAHMHPTETVLHSENGPAIVWQDGSKGYFLYGTEFSEKIWKRIVKGKILIKEIEDWHNIKQMRAALRHLGPKALLKQCETQLIDSTSKGNKLYNVKSVASLRDLKILTYKCPSTGKEYQKFVSNSILDADYAQAWRYKLRKAEYLLLNES